MEEAPKSGMPAQSKEMPVVDEKNPLAKSAGGLSSGLPDPKEVEEKAKQLGK